MHFSAIFWLVIWSMYFIYVGYVHKYIRIYYELIYRQVTNIFVSLKVIWNKETLRMKTSPPKKRQKKLATLWSADLIFIVYIYYINKSIF